MRKNCPHFAKQMGPTNVLMDRPLIEYLKLTRRQFDRFFIVTVGTLRSTTWQVRRQVQNKIIISLLFVVPRVFKHCPRSVNGVNGDVLRNKIIVYAKQRERIISSPNGLINNNAVEVAVVDRKVPNNATLQQFHVFRTAWTRWEARVVP